MKPPPTGTLPAHGKAIHVRVYESAKKRLMRRGVSEERVKARASRQAWCETKRYYWQDKAKVWHRRKQPLGRDEYAPGCKPYRKNPDPIVRTLDLAVAKSRGDEHVLELVKTAQLMLEIGDRREAASWAAEAAFISEGVYDPSDEDIERRTRQILFAANPRRSREKIVNPF